MQNIISVNLLIFPELGLAIYFSSLFMHLTLSDPIFFKVLESLAPYSLPNPRTFVQTLSKIKIFIIKFKLIVLFNIV